MPLDYDGLKRFPVKGVKFLRIEVYVQELNNGTGAQEIIFEPARLCEDGPGIQEFGASISKALEGLNTRTQQQKEVLRAELREFMKTAPVEEWGSQNEEIHE